MSTDSRDEVCLLCSVCSISKFCSPSFDGASLLITGSGAFISVDICLSVSPSVVICLLVSILVSVKTCLLVSVCGNVCNLIFSWESVVGFSISRSIGSLLGSDSDSLLSSSGSVCFRRSSSANVTLDQFHNVYERLSRAKIPKVQKAPITLLDFFALLGSCKKLLVKLW